MPKTEPRTPAQFRDWLQETFDELEHLCRCADPDFFDQLEIAEKVEQASRSACRFGAGHLLAPEHSTLTPRDALPIIGSLLAWSQEKVRKSAALLSAEEVGDLLGVSARSVWRMLSAEEIPQPVRVGGLTKWRRADIETMIDLLPATSR